MRFGRKSKKRRSGMSKFMAGLIGIILIAVFSYLAYTKFANPFAHKYTVHATFANANGLQPGSLVRIAGVNVGTVSSVSSEPGCKSASTTQSACQAADVTMNISNQGLPIHNDATFAIRPRIFLEGNFFVDVSPGTPSAPVAETWPPLVSMRRALWSATPTTTTSVPARNSPTLACRSRLAFPSNAMSPLISRPFASGCSVWTN